MAESFYVLSAVESRALNHGDSDPGGTIVAAAPWIKGSGEVPHRIVLRDLGRALVVHSQIVSVEHGYAFFEHGSYYEKHFDKARIRAWTRFEERARNALGLGLGLRHSVET